MFRILACLVLAIALSAPVVLRADEAVKPSQNEAQPPAEGPGARQKPASPLCFKTTKLCLKRKADPGSPPLNLQLTDADITWMLSQLKVKPETEDGAGTLEVRERIQQSGPDVPGGIGSVIWAVKNPKQAWRILAPVE
jgi:hypothetical protein